MEATHAEDLGESGSGIPEMPDIRPSEQTPSPYPLVEGLRNGIGWQYLPAQRGGAVFVILTKGALGGQKVAERFPLTTAGWEMAWQAVARVDPDAVAEMRVQLAERRVEDERWRGYDSAVAERAELDSVTLACLMGATLLGGYGPSAMVIGERYEVRFLDDRVAAFPARGLLPLAEVPYRQIDDVEIGGPGLVRSGGGFSGGGFGVVGSLEGMAIAGVLNALTTRKSITTILRIEGTNCEFFFLYTQATPEQLRIRMSAALGAIRAEKAAQRPIPTAGQPPAPTSLAGELARLADLLNAGLLTREEFDQLKARIIQG